MTVNNPQSAHEALQQANRLARGREILLELRRGGDYICYTGNGLGVYDILKRGFDGARDRWYTVNLVNETCDCPDHMEHGHTCKHLYAMEMFSGELACEEAADLHVKAMADAECPAGCDYLY